MQNFTENTKFIIQRYDSFISGANVKGNFLLAFNTFLTGGVIADYSELKQLMKVNIGIDFLNICLCLLLILSVITSILVIRAVYPFLVSGNSSKEKYHSHIFFNSVTEFTSAKDYFDSISKQSDDEFNLDLSKQIYQLAKGLKLKYKLLAWAMRLVFSELAIILLILILIILL